MSNNSQGQVGQALLRKHSQVQTNTAEAVALTANGRTEGLLNSDSVV